MKMSFQDYVDHISQKYRLAVAISVINSKPNYLSIDEYLTQLQNKIKDEEFDPNETVCSDDFNFDDDVILKENTQTDNKCDMLNENRPDCSINDNNSDGSQTILNDFAFGDGRLEVNVEGNTSIGGTLRLLKEVATATQAKDNANEHLSQLTFCESQEAITSNDVTHRYDTTNAVDDNMFIQIENNCMDSQETQLYTLQGFTQDYTHVSQTQKEYFVIADKYIRNKAYNNQCNVDNVGINGHNPTDIQMCTDQNVLAITDGRGSIEKSTVSQQTVENSGKAQSSQFLNTANDTGLYKDDEPTFVSQQTVENHCNTKPSQYLKNVKEFTVNTGIYEDDRSTYVSQQTVENQCSNKPPQFLNNVKEFTANTGVYKDTNEQVTKNVNVEVQNVDNTQEFELYLNVLTTGDVTNGQVTQDVDVVENLNNAQKFDLNVNNVTSAKFAVNTCNKFETSGTKEHKDTAISNTPLLLLNSLNTINEIQNVGIDKNKDSQLNKMSSDNIQQEFKDIDDMEIDETGSEENTQEIVPFKVIEELNRVKNFVNKKDKRYDGYSTDSGYKSDSQPRSSLKTSSQLHGAWLNQSAHCLFNHVRHAAATDDIVKQIAQVLGQLIDKLHEEENYPPFLEELLGTVDSMLLDVRVGGGWADNVLITKEENIQRLLLLNKSKHILKYTIEKITNTLEELHTNLTQDLYELTNIVEVENICYIFHVLEILLKRYMKVKDSQSTQNSQEEIFPTRSSLTELWRKKWYPNSKEIIKNDNKICILKRCSEILNKIIVECMDGYSLVAFAALQCFNLMQG